MNSIHVRRFLSRLEVGDECWRLKANNRTLIPHYGGMSAPKFSYCWFHRRDPKLLSDLRFHVRHLCENPWCVRPDHLLEGPASENRLDEKRSKKELQKLQTASRYNIEDVLASSYYG